MEVEKLAAPHNDWSYGEVPKHPYQYQTGKWAYLPDAAKRVYPSNNPVIFLRGGTPWRAPSSYRREIRLWEDVLSYKTSSSSGYSLIGGNQSGAILHSNMGSYWTNMDIDVDESLINESVVKALNHLNDEKAQIGIMFGEAKRTFSLLAETSTKLLKALRAAKRGNWTGVSYHLGMKKKRVLSGRYPANRWLEYQYGWKPLLSDLYDLHNAFRDMLKTHSFLITSRGRADKEAEYESTWSGTGQPKIAKSWRASQVVRTKLTAEIDSPRWRDANQLGLINPLSVGWELVPFSFVIDWFMPIGNTLEAMTARAGLKFVGGHSTVICGGSVKMRTIPTSGITMRRHGTLTLKRYGLRRYAYTTWPMPKLYADNSPFSTVRSLNALALFRAIQGPR